MTSSIHKHRFTRLFTGWLGLVLLFPAVGGHAAAPTSTQTSSVVATAPDGMVAAANAAASQAGADMLQRGGNAIDAAVAASFAISVLRPQSTGIGGGGFLLLYLAEPQQVLAIDFRERAPLQASRDMFVRNGRAVPALSRNGPLAIAVPGLVAGLVDVQQRYGSLSLADVMQPAIRLADEGFPVYPHLARAIAYRAELLGASNATRSLYFRNGQPLEDGDLFVQRGLADTLRAIAAHGASAFYTGRIAEAVVSHVQELGGLLTHADLDRYRVIDRQPISGTFQGARVHSMPPPSSGGVLLVQMLNVLSGFSVQKLGFRNPTAVHILSETLRRAFRDRARYLGDADFVPVPTERLTSAAYAQELRAQIDVGTATPSAGTPRERNGTGAPLESTSTTHLSVVDAQGNAVATTQTVNLYFGSGVLVPGTGIMLNDEMDDFSAQPDQPNAFGLVGNTEANAIAPQKTPLSSMSPTIVTRDGRVELVVGGPGGSRIISSVLQVVLNVLAYQMSLPAAVQAPRIHHQWFPDTLYLEVHPHEQADGRAVGLAGRLRAMGHAVTVVEWEPGQRSRFGNIQAIHVDPDSRLMTGASDPRGEGEPRGVLLPAASAGSPS